jgi:hypothetical protein
MFVPQGYQSYVAVYTDTQTHRHLKTWGQTLQAALLAFKRCLLAALAAALGKEQDYALAWC